MVSSTGVVDFCCDRGGVRGGLVELLGGVVSDELLKLSGGVMSDELVKLQGSVVRDESRD
jgi:hypothetical protein